MNLIVAIKYRLYDNRKAILIFYTVILCVLALLFSITTITVDSDFHGSIEGIEFASAIFLFIVGLNSFKEVFRMFIQNGISRKTLFASHIIATAAIGGIMALMDSILTLLNRTITSINSGVYSRRLIETLYGRQNDSIGAFLTSLFFCFFIYMMFASLGFLITTLYYKMNKVLKISVSVSVPAILFVILPIVDSALFQGVVFSGIARIITMAFINPFMGMISSLVLFTIFSACSWLLMRRAVVRG